MWKTPTEKLFGGGIKFTEVKPPPLDRDADRHWLKEEKLRQQQDAAEKAAAEKMVNDQAYDELMQWQEKMDQIYDEAGNIRPGKEDAAAAAIVENQQRHKEYQTPEDKWYQEREPVNHHNKHGSTDTQDTDAAASTFWQAISHVKNIADAAIDLGSTVTTSAVRAVDSIVREYPNNSGKFYDEFDYNALKRKSIRLAGSFLDASQSAVDTIKRMQNEAAEIRAKKSFEQRNQKRRRKESMNNPPNYQGFPQENSHDDDNTAGATSERAKLRDTVEDGGKKMDDDSTFQTKLYSQWKAVQESAGIQAQASAIKERLKQHVKEEHVAVVRAHADKTANVATEKLSKLKQKITSVAKEAALKFPSAYEGDVPTGKVQSFRYDSNQFRTAAFVSTGQDSYSFSFQNAVTNEAFLHHPGFSTFSFQMHFLMSALIFVPFTALVFFYAFSLSIPSSTARRKTQYNGLTSCS